MSVLNAAQSALIVIDVQESFRHTPDWSEADLPAFRDAVLRLERGARENAVSVIHVFHVGKLPSFTRESGLVRPLDWLPDAPDAVFEKHTHNAFTDTGLDLWLRRHHIGHLVITGIRTEQCCETTARVASDLGYDVTFVIDATATSPIEHRDAPAGRTPADIVADPRTLNVADVMARTEYVLAGRFARIATVDELTAGLDVVAVA
jgi:nicotinamidase-related amidase